MKKYQDIYNFIKSEETAYSLPIQLEEGYEWGMKEHLRISVLYKNSRFSDGYDPNKPFKNIVRPILNLQYRTEGFDVKDIELFVDNAKNYYKSFLVKKYHSKWARENNLDTFIDSLVESYVDFGGALVKKVNSPLPEVVNLSSLAFCDQTDLLGGPIAIKHFYSPYRLKEMAEKGWGDEKNGATISIEDFLLLSEQSKKQDSTETKTPGSYLEIYELHGDLPEDWLKKDGDPDEYVYQIQIVGFYKDEKNNVNWVTLFKSKEEFPFKVILRDGIYGRALGMGGVEELTQPQIWTNYSEIRKKEMMDAASKIVHISDDPNFVNRNRQLNGIENNQVLEIAPNKTIRQLDTVPRSMAIFDQAVNQWEVHAQRMGAAADPLLGEPSPSGTPFRSQERQVIEGKGLHEYRRGKIATFVDEIYHDWIIPHISKEISKGTEFLAELDMEELQEIAERIVNNQANNLIKERILNGELVNPEDVESFKVRTREEFMRGGRKRFLKILKDDFKDAPMSVRINIAGKQADLAGKVDKITNVVRQLLASPQLSQIPGMKEALEIILESSGLSPIMFGKLTKLPVQTSQPQATRSPETALATL